MANRKMSHKYGRFVRKATSAGRSYNSCPLADYNRAADVLDYNLRPQRRFSHVTSGIFYGSSQRMPLDGSSNQQAGTTCGAFLAIATCVSLALVWYSFRATMFNYASTNQANQKPWSTLPGAEKKERKTEMKRGNPIRNTNRTYIKLIREQITHLYEPSATENVALKATEIFNSTRVPSFDSLFFRAGFSLPFHFQDTQTS